MKFNLQLTSHSLNLKFSDSRAKVCLLGGQPASKKSIPNV